MKICRGALYVRPMRARINLALTMAVVKYFHDNPLIIHLNMRRKDKQISDVSTIEAIIRTAQVCRVGFSDNGRAYVVPMSFGYQDRVLYFHCATEGKKIECIRKNPNVCFAFDEAVEPIRHESACRWSMRYKSVIGYGRVEFIGKIADKRHALEIIMRQYSKDQYEFPDTELEKIIVFKVLIDEMSGKQSGY
jgi:uncharacterized protein